MTDDEKNRAFIHIYLNQICDQLTEALGLKDGYTVAAMIDEEIDPHMVISWGIVRPTDADGIARLDGVTYKTIKELLNRRTER